MISIDIKKSILSVVVLLIFPVLVWAATDGTYNITVDNIGFFGGEPATDSTYDLSDTIGEPLVGPATSEDYKTQDGFWYMVNNTLSLVLDSNTEDLGVVVPGTPNTATTTITVVTDSAGGYDLLIRENHKMLHTNDGSTTIDDYSGTIASPTSWGGTGLGFTVTSGSGVEAKWGTAPANNYAGIPTVDTEFHEKNGYTSGRDDTIVEYKIDAPGTQRSGEYTNTVTYTAISKL